MARQSDRHTTMFAGGDFLENQMSIWDRLMFWAIFILLCAFCFVCFFIAREVAIALGVFLLIAAFAFAVAGEKRE